MLELAEVMRCPHFEANLFQFGGFCRNTNLFTYFCNKHKKLTSDIAGLCEKHTKVMKCFDRTSVELNEILGNCRIKFSKSLL